MTEKDKFLTQYKRLEEVLRDSDKPMSVLDYENSIMTAASDDYDRLKVCRIMRNYMQHHADSFLDATSYMTDFVSHTADVIASKKQQAKDIMVRQKSLTMSSSVKDAVSAVSRSKFGIAAVTAKDNTLIGILDSDILLSAIAKKQSLAGKLSALFTEDDLKKLTKRQYIGVTEPDKPAEDVYVKDFEHVIVIKDCIYKGIIK